MLFQQNWKRKMRKRPIAGFVAVFILLGLSSVFVNNICNGHIHQQENGTIVFHAHPYHKSSQKEPVKTHHHTRVELFFYYLITWLFEHSVSIFLVWLFVFADTFFRHCLFLKGSLNPFIFIPSVRAPPIRGTEKSI